MAREFEFSLSGLTCEACSNSVTSTLKHCGLQLTISDLSLDHLFLDVVENTKSDEEIRTLICEAISDIGFDCAPIITESTTSQNKPKRPSRRRFITHLLLGLTGIAAGIALMALMLSGIMLAPLAMYIIAGVSTALTFALGATTFYNAVKQLVKAKTVAMDALLTLSTLTAIAVSIASFFVPGLSMMFDAALFIFGFRHIGKAIEESVTKNIKKKSSFSQKAPNTVDVLIGDTWTSMAVGNVQPGSIIRIPKGRIIPIDGQLLNDDVTVYQNMLNGQQMPYTFTKNKILLAGMRIARDDDKNQFIEIQTTHYAHQSYLVKIDNIIKDRAKHRPRIVSVTEQIVKYFALTVLGIAVTAGIVLSFFFPPMIAVCAAIGIAAAACPCTIGMIIPSLVKTGLSKAEKNNLHFNKRDALQAAADINAVFFDLNGTLTTGELSVTRLAGGKTMKSLLPFIAALETKSDHPFATAIKNKYKSQKIQPTFNNAKSSRHGLSGTINAPNDKFHGKRLTIGNAKLMRDEGIDISNIDSQYPSQDDLSHKVYVALDGKAVGYIELTDPLRDDACFTIDELHKMGIKVYICTGADRKTALAHAKRLNVPENRVFADCENISAAELNNLNGNNVPLKDDPKDNSKPAHVRRAQKNGDNVAMAGDGGNDVFAMLASNLGIAVESSTTSDPVTLSYADAKISGKKLSPIIAALEVGRKTVNNIKLSLGISFTYNMIAILIPTILLVTIGFLLNPAIGAALMVLQAGIVLAVALRLNNQRLKHTEHVNSLVKSNQSVEQTTTKSLLEEMPRHQSTNKKQQVSMSNNKTISWTSKKLAMNPVSLNHAKDNAIKPLNAARI